VSDTPETDNNDYAHTFLEQYGHESSLQGSPVDWADFARRLEIERDMLKSELNEWKTLKTWGGAPEIIDQFIKGQQMRIYAAQEVETDLQAERALADRLADALMSTDAIIRKEVSLVGRWDSPVICKEAIAAWKEARND
jgi:hypothetical protein